MVEQSGLFFALMTGSKRKRAASLQFSRFQLVCKSVIFRWSCVKNISNEEYKQPRADLSAASLASCFSSSFPSAFLFPLCSGRTRLWRKIGRVIVSQIEDFMHYGQSVMGGTSYIRKHCLYNYARTRGSTIAACDFHLDFTPARLFASTYPRFFLCKALRQPVARLRRRRASAAPVSIVSMAIHTPPNQPIFLFLKPSKTLFFHPAVSFFKPGFFHPTNT